MTMDECRDWLARDDGWDYGSTNVAAFPHWHDDRDVPCFDAKCEYAHPYPPTIDGAHAAMPAGWEWGRQLLVGKPYQMVACTVGESVSVPATKDPATDLYRLAVAARVAAKKEQV
jgi:hypothetical protein